MRIGLLVAFAGRSCGGPEVYEREVIRAMVEIAPEHEYHLLCLDQRAPEVIDCQHRSLIYHLLRPSSRVISLLTSFPRVLTRVNPDLLHSLIISPPSTPPNMIMAMPCSSLIRHPEFYPPLIRMRLRFLLHRAVPKAKKIICPSEHVRDVMQEHFNLAADKLPVIHPGKNELFRLIGEKETRAFVEKEHQLNFPYFLFSGRWEHRKNLARTLAGFAEFKRNIKTEYRLVLTGGRSWDQMEFEKTISSLQLEGAVVDLGKTPIDELPYLYGAADALTYASLWEGFGMPIIEAMACGTPVITSNVSAMPETAGGCALLVNPASTEDIAEAMYRLATDEKLRHDLSQKGLKRAQSFSWKRTAGEMLSVYEKIGVGGGGASHF